MQICKRRQHSLKPGQHLVRKCLMFYLLGLHLALKLGYRSSLVCRRVLEVKRLMHIQRNASDNNCNGLFNLGLYPFLRLRLHPGEVKAQELELLLQRRITRIFTRARCAPWAPGWGASSSILDLGTAILIAKLRHAHPITEQPGTI